MHYKDSTWTTLVMMYQSDDLGGSLSNSRSDTFKTSQPGHIRKSTQPWETTLTSEKTLEHNKILGHFCRNAD